MKDFQLLCATMNQVDFRKVNEMKIESDIIFANQTNNFSENDIEINNNNVAKMINTNTVGLSINRNILLTFANADICMFSDDDVKYYSGYKNKIIDAFKRHPDADMIIFNLDTDSESRKLYRIKRERKMHRWERNPYGSVRIAFKLCSQRKFNVWFNVLLGAGSKYKSGEDTLFINEFRKKGKVVLCPDVIGKVDFFNSTWFKGYTEEYFFNQGAKIECLYSTFKWVMVLYYAFSIKGNLSVYKKIECMRKGIESYKNLNGSDM